MRSLRSADACLRAAAYGRAAVMKLGLLRVTGACGAREPAIFMTVFGADLAGKRTK